MDSLPCSQPLTERQLSRILKYSLGNSEIEVQSFSLEYMTKPGQNYGGTIRRLTVILTNGKSIDFVAKFIPPTSFLQNVFASHITFKKEVNMYELIIPEFLKLQREKGFPEKEILDLFPKYYGSQINTNNVISLEADENAILLLENLQESKYKLNNCFVGLDLAHAIIAVSDLAKLHAFSVVLQKLKPQTFKETVLKICIHVFIGAENGTDSRETFVDTILKKYEDIPTVKHLADKIKNLCKKNRFLQNVPIVEPLASIVHTDFWVNNMMFKYDTTLESKPIHIKIFDFQGIEYSSPLRDFVFFVYTSLNDDVLKEHYNEILHCYHSAFTEVLKKFHICLDNYHFDDFCNEIKRIAPFELFHIIFMLDVIFADSEDAIEQINVTNFKSLPMANNKRCIDKFTDIVKDFVAKGWI